MIDAGVAIRRRSLMSAGGCGQGGGRPAERRFTVGGSGKSVARCHRTVLAYWKFEAESRLRTRLLQRRARGFFPRPAWMGSGVMEREFYRSARGPAPTDEDTWRLVFDPRAMRLLVRHEWEAAGHNGVDEFEIAEFLAQDGAGSTELIKILFGRVPVEA